MYHFFAYFCLIFKTPLGLCISRVKIIIIIIIILVVVVVVVVVVVAAAVVVVAVIIVYSRLLVGKIVYFMQTHAVILHLMTL